MATSEFRGRFWEWLGWKSPHIAAHRIEARAARCAAEEKLQNTYERVTKSKNMSDWLRRRNKENHISEALNRALDHPRRTV